MPTISIQERRARTLSQHDAAARLRVLLDATVDAIVTIDPHGIIESVNRATERMFGYDAGEMLGSNVSMLMAPPHREHHDRYLQRYLMTGERRIIGVGREVEAQRKDGTRFPVDLAVTEFEANGQRMFTGLIRDISDRRAAERAAQRRLDELAHAGRLADLGLTTSTIAHEVNQPLAAIVSFAHACQRMLDRGTPDRDVLRNALGQIAEQGERASTIIARVRAMASKRESVTESVDANATVRGVLEMMARQLRYEKVELEIHLAEDLPAVRSDRIHVEQVLMNLLTNAIDAMHPLEPEGRRISVTTSLDGERVRISVTDSGPGLDPHHAERVFENFFTTKPHGMGVGLSICKSLAEAHGGRLWAQATPEGARGATFHYTIPVQP